MPVSMNHPQTNWTIGGYFCLPGTQAVAESTSMVLAKCAWWWGPRECQRLFQQCAAACTVVVAAARGNGPLTAWLNANSLQYGSCCSCLSVFQQRCYSSNTGKGQKGNNEHGRDPADCGTASAGDMLANVQPPKGFVKGGFSVDMVSAALRQGGD
jgi:hypothetical protein